MPVLGVLGWFGFVRRLSGLLPSAPRATSSKTYDRARVLSAPRSVNPFAPKPKTILEGFDGLLLPGEMCLVLGRPGSGCSSFLMSIAGQRETFLETKGDVRYAGIEAELMRKLYPGEVVYNQEDDVHLPTLSVGQTLDFALSTKTPGKRLPGTSTSDFRKQVLGASPALLGRLPLGRS